MDKEAKQQYMETLRGKYFKANKKEKGRILDEYCRNTKQDRKYVIKKFNYKVRMKAKEEHRKREPLYDGSIISALVNIWEIFDYPCGQRLKPIIREELDRLRKLKEVKCSNKTAEKLKNAVYTTFF